MESVQGLLGLGDPPSQRATASSSGRRRIQSAVTGSRPKKYRRRVSSSAVNRVKAAPQVSAAISAESSPSGRDPLRGGWRRGGDPDDSVEFERPQHGGRQPGRGRGRPVPVGQTAQWSGDLLGE
nr:hypothetical protein GCM10020092_075350 [Actinoplanes digitatis]